MIEKMKFLTITGPKNDIDRVIDQYLSKYEIQLENTLSELKNVENVSPYMEINPYKEALEKVNVLAELVKEIPCKEKKLSVEEAVAVADKLEAELASIQKQKEELKAKLDSAQSSLTDIEHFRAIPHNIEDILHFQHVKYRFGKISQEYYAKFEKYVYDDLDTIFYKCQSDENYVWGVYFVPAKEADKIDAVFSSLHFERLYLKDTYHGTAEEAYQISEKQVKDYTDQLSFITNAYQKKLEEHAADLLAAQKRLSTLSENFDVRKLAACTKTTHGETFYILCGWMTEKDALRFSREIEKDEKLYCIIEDGHNNIYSQPPTKLKNPKIFKPYEMYIRMYGLPAYNEMDPTIFVAITYSFIFGAMFGDVGQGLCLFLGGALLYKLKKMNLAAIISMAGIFSTVFGFLFGSVFGFETIIKPIWLRPIVQMTQLPFIGNLNTVFVYAIGFGMLLILVIMIFNILNGLKTHDIENAFFGTNGVAGLIFYGSLTLTIFLFMSGHAIFGTAAFVLLFGLPLLAMALKEPLTSLVEKKAKVMPEQKGMFVVQAFFELFEILLGYFSNTLSFVRIGAFAVSHAAMMEVVVMLSGAENGGNPNWIVIILGNLFVMGMEGLIVGIQVLRLEYYEFFSRFYKGSGREFKPYSKIKA